MANVEEVCSIPPVAKCVLEATVVTGFEGIAKDECKEKLAVNAKIERGRIFFEIETNRVNEVLKLRGIDNVLVIVKDINHFNLANQKAEVFSQLLKLPWDVDWLPSLRVWKEMTKFDTPLEDIVKCMGLAQPRVSDEPKENIDSKENIHKDSGSNITAQDSEEKDMKNTETSKIVTPKLEQDKSTLPRFRVTCNRSGKKHSFSSQEAACQFGGAVQDYFQWQVDMKNYDIEVVLTINEQRVYISLAVTKESLHKRNLDQYGPTSLRSTIAYNMLRMCSIRCGDVVCDPMCGGGSIPIEGKLSFPGAHFICGDSHDLAWARTLHNMSVLSLNGSSDQSLKSAIDVQKWDARNLPLKDNSIDIIITDLPFGKRMGSRTDNRTLYPQILREMARVCRKGKGRAILLTQDRQSLTKTVTSLTRIWWQKRVLAVNIGGLAASVYVLQRTNYSQDKTYPRPPQEPRSLPEAQPVPKPVPEAKIAEESSAVNVAV